jgi:hypothetical protein
MCLSDRTREVASHLGKRCDLDDGWTWRDGFQTLHRSWRPLQNRGRSDLNAHDRQSTTREIGPRTDRRTRFRSKRDGFQALCSDASPEATVDELVSAYVAGSSIDALAARLGVNRTTIISHLDRRGVERRNVVRKMTDRSVGQAGKCYEAGESLKVVAVWFGVDSKNACPRVPTRRPPDPSRRGWPPST